MRYNPFVRLLGSIPVILIFIYFVPFLGICLLFLRYFIYDNTKKNMTPFLLISFAILILIPRGLDYLFNLLKLDTTVIPYYNTIISSDLYNNNFMNYSKTLFTIGIIYLILSTLLSKISRKINRDVTNYMTRYEERTDKIRQENDLIVKERAEKAKNTHVVHCPYCGSDNMLTEQTGTCKFCRRKIEYKG